MPPEQLEGRAWCGLNFQLVISFHQKVSWQSPPTYPLSLDVLGASLTHLFVHSGGQLGSNFFSQFVQNIGSPMDNVQNITAFFSCPDQLYMTCLSIRLSVGPLGYLVEIMTLADFC